MYIVLLSFIISGLALSQGHKNFIKLGVDGDMYNVEGFSTYKKFTTRIEEYIADKMQGSFLYIFRASSKNTSEFVSYITQEKFIVLQLLYAFYNKDIVYTNLLLEVADSFETYRPRRLRLWLENNINLEKEEMYETIRYAALGSKNGMLEIPKQITDQLIFMNDKYEIFERACRSGDVDTILWFIKAGFDLGSVSWSVFEDAWIVGHYNVMKVLMENGYLNKVNVRTADVNKIINNETIVHVVTKLGLVSVATRLLQIGADVNRLDGQGKTPLHVAVEEKKIDMLTYLVSQGASVAVADSNTGDSLLHEAVALNYIDIVVMLLKFGAPPNYKNARGLTPLFTAVLTENTKLIYVLAFNKADVNATSPTRDTLMHLACALGNAQVVDALIKLGCAIDLKNDLEETPAYVAAKNGWVPLIGTLVLNGADLTTRDRKGLTLLHKAAKLGDVVAVSALIRSGVKIDIRGDKGVTPLFVATDEGHASAVQYLLQNGADPNLTNDGKWTPMHIAALLGFEDIVKLLIDYKTNLYAVTATGLNALDIARKYEHRTIVKLIGEKMYPDFEDIDERMLSVKQVIDNGTK